MSIDPADAVHLPPPDTISECTCVGARVGGSTRQLLSLSLISMAVVAVFGYVSAETSSALGQSIERVWTTGLSARILLVQPRVVLRWGRGTCPQIHLLPARFKS